VPFSYVVFRLLKQNWQIYGHNYQRQVSRSLRNDSAG
jgi:hypothetical protein